MISINSKKRKGWSILALHSHYSGSRGKGCNSVVPHNIQRYINPQDVVIILSLRVCAISFFLYHNEKKNLTGMMARKAPSQVVSAS